jgi:PAS domain S-box-containing protein
MLLRLESILLAGLTTVSTQQAWKETWLASTRLDVGETTDTLFRAVAAVADALYVVDPRGRIAFLNPAALKILGYTDEHELLGKPSHATIHFLRPDGSPFPEEECPLLRPLLSGATVWIERDSFVRSDGSSVPVAYSSAPVELDNGRGAVVVFRDLSVEPLGRRERPNPLETLTAREQDVVELMAQGRSNAAIAGALSISEGAVEKHIKHIFGKLRIPAAPDTHRRVLAVLAFLEAR